MAGRYRVAAARGRPIIRVMSRSACFTSPGQVVLAAGLVLALAACDSKAPSAWSGYAEGDYVYVAAPLAGALTVLAVQAGQQVARGAPLFVLESDLEQAGRAEAQARLEQAQAQADNSTKGRRRDEIAITQAQLAQARAQAALATSDLERQQQ